QTQEFNTALQAAATWKIDQYKGKRATPLSIKYIPKFYFDTRLIQLLRNRNLKNLWTCMISNNNDTAMWTSLAQMGMNGAFSGEKTFTELASLILQIKTKEDAGISMKGLRYSEYFTHFFSLLSGSSREYEIFHKKLGGMSIQRICQIRASNPELITNPNLIIENVMRFACLMKELKWEGPILLMTDCTKICSKLIPIGKIPPVVIDILPTKGDESAEQIFNILRIVLDFAYQSNINILSMGTDGTRSEFNAQIQIINLASTYFTFDDPFYNVHLKVPIINGKPLVRVQDPKHAKKTINKMIVLHIEHFHSKNLAQIVESENIPSNMIGILFTYLSLCSIISMQSFEIFISMAESLVMLILVHRYYYSNYPLFLWEHRTEALKYIFDISRQVILDFNFYKFYKIQKRIIHQDKISHAGLIDISRDQTSAASYVFDINEAIRIRHYEAIALAKYFQIDNKTVLSIQPLAHVEFFSDDLDISKMINNENNQYQNLIGQIESQIESEDIGTVCI
ncbi:3303_t:CDS:2, partial [Funneliformis geosporum]